MSGAGPVLITGATSGIAAALADRLAARGTPLVLAARDEGELARIAGDLRLRHGGRVETVRFDARDLGAIPAFFQACLDAAGGLLEGIVVCHGYLGDQARAEREPSEALAIVETNYTSCVPLLNLAAEHLEAQGTGFICGISSVAGDRGRQSNYVYGSAKGGLDRLLQGLRNRLAPGGIAVTTVKPGFVDTAMTYGLPGLFLVARPERVARDIDLAIRRGRHQVYTPWFWRFIMLAIRWVPEAIFKRLKL